MPSDTKNKDKEYDVTTVVLGWPEHLPACRDSGYSKTSSSIVIAKLISDVSF